MRLTVVAQVVAEGSFASRLFDDGSRTDASAAGYGEDHFTFLNRAASRYWERVRLELDRWFASYPAAGAADLRARFRSRRPAQHWGAWWELYLFRLFTCLGFHIEVHPTVSGTDARPDFLLKGGGQLFYVEAATVFSGIVEEGRDDAREAGVLDLINQGRSHNFFVSVEFHRVGLESPSRNEITRPIEEWLAKCDPDLVAAEIKQGADPPELPLRVRDWELTVEAFPIKPEFRGEPPEGLIGSGPISSGYVNDVEMVHRTLSKKFQHLRSLDQPLVVAVLGMSSFLGRSDVEQALFGREAVQFQREPPHTTRLVRQRNGVWMRGAGPAGKSVAAVLCASRLSPSNAARVLPKIWVNPWATNRLPVLFPFVTATADDHGAVSYSEATSTASEILGLASDWPGPEEPFE